MMAVVKTLTTLGEPSNPGQDYQITQFNNDAIRLEAGRFGFQLTGPITTVDGQITAGAVTRAVFTFNDMPQFEITRLVMGNWWVNDLLNRLNDPDTNAFESLFAGNDRIHGGVEDDIINTFNGADTVFAGDGGDLVTSGEGHDQIWTGLGDDAAYGGGGNDRLFGGAGNDTLDGGDGFDIIHGGTGNDLLIGNLGSDLLYGGAGQDTLRGGVGDDALWGGLADDVLWGDAGFDRLWGADGQDRLDGGGGNDTLWGNAGNDLLAGNIGADKLFGGDGRDRLDGDGGADRLFAGAGDDDVEGGWGNDVLMGGFGADSFHFRFSDGRDVIADFGRGADVLVFHDTRFAPGYDTDDFVRDHARQANGDTIIEIQDLFIRIEDFQVTPMRLADMIIFAEVD